MPARDIQSIKQRYGIIGGSDQLNQAINVALQIAPLDLSVLVLGESGVGKEVFSRIIHDNSLRKGKKFIAINCGAMPEGTIDSELFGHVKGAFTSAVGDRKGYFEDANGGTIFLDEIGDMPLSTQVRLLRLLESGEFIRVGSNDVQKTDVRIVAATNKDLRKAIQENRFREDLYYRLSAVPIHIPPLRERRGDIPFLFRKFANEYAEQYRMPKAELTDEAYDLMSKYYWRGNIRQLKNVAESVIALFPGVEVTAEMLKPYLPQDEAVTLPSAPVRMSQGEQGGGGYERDLLLQVMDYMKKKIEEMEKEIAALKEGGTMVHGGNEISHSSVSKSGDITDIEEYNDDKISMSDVEKESIIKVLRKHNGNRREAAEELGISPRTIYRKITQYDIDL